MIKVGGYLIDPEFVTWVGVPEEDEYKSGYMLKLLIDGHLIYTNWKDYQDCKKAKQELEGLLTKP